MVLATQKAQAPRVAHAKYYTYIITQTHLERCVCVPRDEPYKLGGVNFANFVGVPRDNIKTPKICLEFLCYFAWLRTLNEIRTFFKENPEQE